MLAAKESNNIYYLHPHRRCCHIQQLLHRLLRHLLQTHQNERAHYDYRYLRLLSTETQKSWSYHPDWLASMDVKLNCKLDIYLTYPNLLYRLKFKY